MKALLKTNRDRVCILSKYEEVESVQMGGSFMNCGQCERERSEDV